jgi:two-component system sensor histidine kinase KdpD
MPYQRKTPEELLLTISKLHRGRLKILIGAVSGSGKTYHLLQEGLQLKKDGIDVVIGLLSTPLRPETAELADGLECVPSLLQGGVDLDALVERNPEVVLVDGLAHINRPGSRFHDRLGEVMFLLDRGISVITTINVYELDGIDETVLKWMDIQATHTVPADTLELADEVRLIDVSPETMLGRLEAGLLGDAAHPAMAQRGNLAILRELSLRLVAEGVNDMLEKHRGEKGLSGPSGASETILVTAQYVVNGSLYVRRGRQIARRLNGELIVAAYVPPGKTLSKEEQAIKRSIMKMTEKADGSFEELPQPRRRKLPAALAQYAADRQATRIVMGHSKKSRWQQLLQGSLADGVLRRLEKVDLLLMADLAEHEGERIMPVRQRGDSKRELFRRFSMEEKERQIASYRRGELKVYIGAAPGVGKTYTMLAEANLLLAKGVDVVIGLVETHGRADTLGKIGLLPIIERQVIPYKGTSLEEMDVDAIIRRNPEVVLVDELAHTNVPGSARKKRYEDVVQLLEHGISVISTMNIQHIESLNDAVEQLTGVRVRETVPDAILRLADQVELIDVTPQMLQSRMREGKIYAMAKVEQALGAFFSTGNLIALRELALREVADDVDERLESWDRRQTLRGELRRREIIFVAVDIRSGAEQLVRRGFRTAYRLKAEWRVHYVHDRSEWSPGDAAKRDSVMKLVERLGGKFETSLTANKKHIAETLLTAASQAKATQLVIGQPARSMVGNWLKGNTVRKLLRLGRHMDVLIVARQTK